MREKIGVRCGDPRAHYNVAHFVLLSSLKTRVYRRCDWRAALASAVRASGRGVKMSVLEDYRLSFQEDNNMSDQQGSFESTVAVSSIFERVKPLQDQLAGLTHILEPMQQLAQLATVFKPLKEFEAQITELAKVLEPMHNFRSQLRTVLQQFTPLRDLNAQLDQLAIAFGESLRQLTEALEPAATLQDRLADLVNAFEPAKILHQEFSALAETFDGKSRSLAQ
ncbi:MAG: hypothetical protein WAU33_11670 [Candidatus Binataceae bacterium]